MKLLDRYMDFASRGSRMREATAAVALAWAICFVILLAIFIPLAMFGVVSYALARWALAVCALGSGIGALWELRTILRGKP